MPPLLLGMPGDNTFSNYAGVDRAFWRQTVLLVARVQKSFHAWLRPGFGAFRLDYNADRLEALATFFLQFGFTDRAQSARRE